MTKDFEWLIAAIQTACVMAEPDDIGRTAATALFRALDAKDYILQDTLTGEWIRLDHVADELTRGA